MFRAFARGTFPSLDPFWIILGWPIDHFKRKWNNLPSINFQQICWFSRGAEPQQSCHAPFLEDTLIPNSEAGKLETLPLPKQLGLATNNQVPSTFWIRELHGKKNKTQHLYVHPKLVSSLGEVGWVFFVEVSFSWQNLQDRNVYESNRNSGP